MSCTQPGQACYPGGIDDNRRYHYSEPAITEAQFERTIERLENEISRLRSRLNDVEYDLRNKADDRHDHRNYADERHDHY